MNTTSNSFVSKETIPLNKDFAGTVKWRCPSNIALIKYWGKRPEQIPMNPSISFTLSHASTDTAIHFRPRKKSDTWVKFFFEDRPNEAFGARVAEYFKKISEWLPWMEQLAFTVESKNTFPHSSGIASSASSMGALSLGLCDIEQVLTGSRYTEEVFLQKASFFARLGSGSACRSVYGTMALWGESESQPNSSNEFAIPVTPGHEIFSTFHDDIVIVSSDVKKVSSSEGHRMMDSNIYAPARYKEARLNLIQLMKYMDGGDLMGFGRIVEKEALTLHALMMCSTPSFMLMRPNTLHILEEISLYREKTGHPVFFTLDAGPNVHILYPAQVATEVKEFIRLIIAPMAENNLIIRDRVGSGPQKLG